MTIRDTGGVCTVESTAGNALDVRGLAAAVTVIAPRRPVGGDGRRTGWEREEC